MSEEAKQNPSSPPKIETQDMTKKEGAESKSCPDPNCETCKRGRRFEALDRHTDRLVIVIRACVCVGFTKLGILITLLVFQLVPGLAQVGVLLSIVSTGFLGYWAHGRFRAGCREMAEIREETMAQSMPMLPLQLVRLPRMQGSPTGAPPSTPPAKA